jgi:hypothetical protein
MKKTVSFVFGALCISASAFATSSYRTLADCTLAQADIGFGLEVKVEQYFGPTARNGVTSATVTMVAIPSAYPPITFNDLTVTKPAPGIMGAAGFVEGQDFSLEIDPDAAPTQKNGKILGHLTYGSNGRRFSHEMGCDYYPTN